MVEKRAKRAQPRQKRLVLVVARELAKLLANALVFLACARELAKLREQHLPHAHALAKIGLLGQRAHAYVRGAVQLAAIGQNLAGDDAQKRAFAAAVAPDECDSLAHLELQ